MKPYNSNNLETFVWIGPFLYFFLFAPYLIIFSPKFVLSSIWAGLGSFIFILAMFFLLLKIWQKNNMEQEIYAIRWPIFNKQREKLITPLLIFGILILFGPLGLIKAPGLIGTELVGQKFESQFLFEKIGHDCGEHGKKLHLSLPERRNVGLCIRPQDFEIAQDGHYLTLKGKKSFFGRTVEKYAILEGNFHNEEKRR